MLEVHVFASCVCVTDAHLTLIEAQLSDSHRAARLQPHKSNRAAHEIELEVERSENNRNESSSDSDSATVS